MFSQAFCCCTGVDTGGVCVISGDSGHGEQESIGGGLPGAMLVESMSPLGVEERGEEDNGLGALEEDGAIFAVELVQGQKRSNNYGALFFDDGEALEVIALVEGGPMKLHNDAADDGSVVRAGDLVVSTNGVTNSLAMLGEWKNRRKIHIEVCRPRRFNIKINKDGPLGVTVIHGHPSKGASLVLDTISDGPFMKWNVANPSASVQRLDRIVAVNGLQGTPDELTQALGSCGGMVTLTMARRLPSDAQRLSAEA